MTLELFKDVTEHKSIGIMSLWASSNTLPVYTNQIYVSIFKENAKEYRKILRLHEKDKVRDTFYFEVLDLISSFEYGFAKVLEKVFTDKGTQFLKNHECGALAGKIKNGMDCGCDGL